MVCCGCVMKGRAAMEIESHRALALKKQRNALKKPMLGAYVQESCAVILSRVVKAVRSQKHFETLRVGLADTVNERGDNVTVHYAF